MQPAVEPKGQGACHEQTSREGRKLALFDLTHSELQQLFLSLGEPRYRADQLYRWLYSSLTTDFAQMYNLPDRLRVRLRQIADIGRLTPLKEIVSTDGLTRKVLFELPDGETIESVLMLYDGRNTACLSTQVGCALGCRFCATGQSGFSRNLSPGEIVEQALYFSRALREKGLRITNLVFMGMGEPLMNYEATWQAIQTMTDSRGYNLGARRITLSTAGIPFGIERLSRQSLQLRLAVSLHAPDDALRDTLVPINRRYPLQQLMTACADYVNRTRRRVTFEYALAEGLNDSRRQAVQLAHLLDGLLCHVNLIPLNPIPHLPWQPSSPRRVHVFHEELKRCGIECTVRARRGLEIQAGCGQLRSRRGDTAQGGDCLLR